MKVKEVTEGYVVQRTTARFVESGNYKNGEVFVTLEISASKSTLLVELSRWDLQKLMDEAQFAIFMSKYREIGSTKATFSCAICGDTIIEGWVGGEEVVCTKCYVSPQWKRGK